MTLWWLEFQKDINYFLLITLYKCHMAVVLHKNGETPAVIGHPAIVRADHLPTNGVSHLHLMQQHSREVTMCMPCNTTTTVGKDTKPHRDLHLCFRSHCKQAANWPLLQEPWKCFKCCRKDICVLAVRSLHQLKADLFLVIKENSMQHMVLTCSTVYLIRKLLVVNSHHIWIFMYLCKLVGLIAV